MNTAGGVFTENTCLEKINSAANNNGTIESSSNRIQQMTHKMDVNSTGQVLIQRAPVINGSSTGSIGVSLSMSGPSVSWSIEYRLCNITRF